MKNEIETDEIETAKNTQKALKKPPTYKFIILLLLKLFYHI